MQVTLGVDADDPQPASGVNQAGKVADDLVRTFLVRIVAVSRLEPDGIDAPVDSAHVLLAQRQAGAGTELTDLLDRTSGREIHRSRPQLAGHFQALGPPVNHVHGPGAWKWPASWVRY